MKNYEKYETKINEYNGSEFCVDFVMPYILGSDNCADMDCVKCRTIQTIWLLKEYEESKEPKEPEIDWSKIKVDTPILVRDNKDNKWLKRYFAKYEDGLVYAWLGENTSYDACGAAKWKYAKLAESEKKCREPKIDWNKVKVDTVILVKTHKAGEWFKRHFAKYKNGKVYTWIDGYTSNDTSRMVEWEYAKLIED